MKLYKLTTSDGRTRPGEPNETRWTPREWVEVSGGGELCGPGWLHAYEDPLVGLFLNPIHADLPDDLIVWEAEGDGSVLRDGPLKLGVTRLRILRPVSIERPTTIQHVAFAIECALAVNKDAAFVAWAKAWLSGEDRTAGAAAATTWAAWAAGATWEARVAAAEAAWAAGAAEAAGAATILDLPKLARRAVEVR